MRRIFLTLCALVFFCGVAAAQEPSPPPSAPAISSVEEVPDAALQSRIEQIFATLDRLDRVTVGVQAGVVVLRGDVLADADRATAVGIARRVTGVVDVRDEIEVSRDLRARGYDVLERLADRIEGILYTVPLILVAALVFLLFLFLSRLIGRWTGFAGRLTSNPMLRQLILQTARAGVVLLGLLLALEVLDATSLIGAVLGAAGLTGLVLGFALKETVENYVAGLLLSLRQPFGPHDHILVQGHEGHVIRLTSRATVLMTLDGNHVRIPNAEVFKGTLVNYSRNPERRFEFEIGVGVQTDLIEAQRLATATLAGMPGVLEDPPPDAWVQTLGDSNVVLMVLGWIDQRTHSLPKVRGEAIRRVKIAFEAADFDLPEPIYRVNMIGGGQPAPAGGPAPQPAKPLPSRTPSLDAEVDLSRDTHIDEEVSEERARMSESDLLDPAARKE